MQSENCYSQEEFNLFNPAYCGVLIYEAIRQYQSIDPGGMHCLLPYLVIPMSTSSEICHLLPSSTRSPLAGWAVDNEGSLISLAEMAASFMPIVDQAIYFLFEKKAISISEGGCFAIQDGAIAANPILIKSNKNSLLNYKSAGFIGRWFAATSSVENIFAHLGVKP